MRAYELVHTVYNYFVSPIYQRAIETLQIIREVSEVKASETWDQMLLRFGVIILSRSSTPLLGSQTPGTGKPITAFRVHGTLVFIAKNIDADSGGIDHSAHQGGL